MGFNTTVVIYNDALHNIAKDPNIGQRIVDACQSLGMRGKEPVDFSYVTPNGGCGSAGIAVETHHADGHTIVAVGGNTATVLSDYAGGYTASKETMLRNLADQMGFTLRKKAKRKPRT